MLEPNRTPVQRTAEGGQLQPLRRRLAAWVAAGVAPPGLAPAAVAAAHLRVTGRPAARDSERPQYRVYSADELRAALIELAGRSPRPAPPPPPPLDPLPLIWRAAGQRLAMPSTRMLLSQQCRLLELRESTYSHRNPGELVARVAVVPRWLPLVKARIHLIGNAMGDTLGRVVAIELQEVAP